MYAKRLRQTGRERNGERELILETIIFIIVIFELKQNITRNSRIIYYILKFRKNNSNINLFFYYYYLYFLLLLIF